MTFGASIRTCFRKYVTFSGRATRSEYWFFVLFLFLTSSAISIVDATLFAASIAATAEGTGGAQNGPLSAIYGLATLLPAIAVGWRRMHDSGRSGLFLFYPVIVMVGLGGAANFAGGLETVFADGIPSLINTFTGLVIGFAMLVLIISPLLVIWWLTRPSDPHDNKYGAAPIL